MPVIKRFGGFVIRIYANDHSPPCVHVEETDFRALVSILNASILRGNIPAKFSGEALDWISGNAAVLLRKWEELQ